MNPQRGYPRFKGEKIEATKEDLVEANCFYIMRDLAGRFKEELIPKKIVEFADQVEVNCVSLAEHICYALLQMCREKATPIWDTKSKITTKVQNTIGTSGNFENSELPDNKTIRDLKINPEIYRMALIYLKKSRQ